MAFNAAFLFRGVADLANFAAANFTRLDDVDTFLVVLRLAVCLRVVFLDVLRLVAERLVVDFLRLKIPMIMNNLCVMIPNIFVN